MANVGSVIAFRQQSDDEARALAKALPGVTAAQLQHLERFEIAMRLSLAPGLVTSTMTGTTLPPAPSISDPAALREGSARRWGQTLEDIDAALARRHGLADEHRQADGDADATVLGVTQRRRS